MQSYMQSLTNYGFFGSYCVCEIHSCCDSCHSLVFILLVVYIYQHFLLILLIMDIQVTSLMVLPIALLRVLVMHLSMWAAYLSLGFYLGIVFLGHWLYVYLYISCVYLENIYTFIYSYKQHREIPFLYIENKLLVLTILLVLGT